MKIVEVYKEIQDQQMNIVSNMNIYTYYILDIFPYPTFKSRIISVLRFLKKLIESGWYLEFFKFVTSLKSLIVILLYSLFAL